MLLPILVNLGLTVRYETEQRTGLHHWVLWRGPCIFNVWISAFMGMGWISSGGGWPFGLDG